VQLKAGSVKKIDITKYCSSISNRNTHLLALEIAEAYKDSESILLTNGTEGFDIVENGIEKVVQEIADTLQIPYEKIQFESADILTKSNIFVHKKKMNTILVKQLQPIDHTPPTKHGFGLFLGRATNERLYAFWKSLMFKDGIRTLHHDVNSIEEHTSEFVGFICEHNEKWKKIKELLPYSDTGHTIDYENDKGDILRLFQEDERWKNIYDNIGMEVICETNTTADTFFITEKTTRPMFYGRMFLTVASPDYEKNLKDFGFDIFDDIIDKSYDNLEGYLRVDGVFKSLQRYLQKPIDYSIIEKRLKHNQLLVVKASHERLL